MLWFGQMASAEWLQTLLDTPNMIDESLAKVAGPYESDGEGKKE
jgi:hypothetical protein